MAKSGNKYFQTDPRIRFEEKYSIYENGCWVWNGCINNGYGQFWYKGKPRLAHLFNYENLKERVPKGFELDHLCRNRACVNPNHLEVVTRRENVLRGKMGKLRTNRSSKYPGVTWDKERNKWSADIYINGKHRKLGRFEKEIDAASAYELACV